MPLRSRFSVHVAGQFGNKLRQAGILKSMGTIGDALDNALVESFLATLQNLSNWTATGAETRHWGAVAIFEYIDGWYNFERRHSYTNHQVLSFVPPGFAILLA